MYTYRVEPGSCVDNQCNVDGEQVPFLDQVRIPYGEYLVDNSGGRLRLYWHCFRDNENIFHPDVVCITPWSPQEPEFMTFLSLLEERHRLLAGAIYPYDAEEHRRLVPGSRFQALDEKGKPDEDPDWKYWVGYGLGGGGVVPLFHQPVAQMKVGEANRLAELYPFGIGEVLGLHVVDMVNHGQPVNLVANGYSALFPFDDKKYRYYRSFLEINDLYVWHNLECLLLADDYDRKAACELQVVPSWMRPEDMYTSPFDEFTQESSLGRWNDFLSRMRKRRSLPVLVQV